MLCILWSKRRGDTKCVERMSSILRDFENALSEEETQKRDIRTSNDNLKGDGRDQASDALTFAESGPNSLSKHAEDNSKGCRPAFMVFRKDYYVWSRGPRSSTSQSSA